MFPSQVSCSAAMDSGKWHVWMVTSSMAKSLPVENLLPQNVGSIINSNVTEAAQLITPSCSRTKPATDNGVRDGGSNWLVVPPPPPSWAVRPECLVHSINQCSLSGNRTCNHLACIYLIYLVFITCLLLYITSRGLGAYAYSLTLKVRQYHH